MQCSVKSKYSLLVYSCNPRKQLQCHDAGISGIVQSTLSLLVLSKSRQLQLGSNGIHLAQQLYLGENDRKNMVLHLGMPVNVSFIGWE